jgi:hypothetical protein
MSSTQPLFWAGWSGELQQHQYGTRTSMSEDSLAAMPSSRAPSASACSAPPSEAGTGGIGRNHKSHASNAKTSRMHTRMSDTATHTYTGYTGTGSHLHLHKAKPMHKAEAFNPVLMHTRYPYVSKKQTGRWGTETGASYKWRKGSPKKTQAVSLVHSF